MMWKEWMASRQPSVTKNGARGARGGEEEGRMAHRYNMSM